MHLTAEPATAETPTDGGLDAKAEVSLIAELLLGHAAKLVASTSERGMVAGLCEALTRTTPHLLVAWTWFGPDDTRRITPQIVAGRASKYASGLVIDKDARTRTGPAYRALAGEPAMPFQIHEISSFEPWRVAVAKHGIRSVLALPLRSATEGHRGIFVLYADLPDYFERVGVPLFEALAQLFAALLTAASDRCALETAARCDALTGLGNRRMAGTVERAMYRSESLARESCVLLIDIDHFKYVNDLHGHGTGDQVLREVADRLSTLVRSDDHVLRWGGEEFLVCLPGVPLDRAVRVAEKIRAGIAGVRYDSGRIDVTVSIGVAELGVDMPLNVATEAADVALYAAKRAGRNRVMAG